MEENIIEENKKKNRKGAIAFVILSIVLVIAIIVGAVYAIYRNQPKTYTQIVSSTDDMQNMINTIYEGVEAELPPKLNT